MGENIVNCIIKAMGVDLPSGVPFALKILNNDISKFESAIKESIVNNNGTLKFGELLDLLNEKVLNKVLKKSYKCSTRCL